MPHVLASSKLRRIGFLLVLAAPCLKAQQMPGMTMPNPEPKPEPTPAFAPLSQPADLLHEIAARPALSLEVFLTHAAAQNPTLAQTRALTQRAEALATQSALFPNPTLGYQGDQIRGGAFGGGEQGAFLAQTIPLGGKLTLRRKAFEAEAQSSKLSTAIQSQRIRADVTSAFYTALAAQESAQITDRLFALAQDATETAHQLANIGQADTPDVLSTEIEQEQAQIAAERAQRQFLADFRTLATLAGTPALQPAPLTGDLAILPTLDPTTILDAILLQNPAVQQARSQVTAAEARLAAAHRDIVPDLQLKAGEQYNFEHLGNTSQPHPTGPQTFASAGISLPLWNRNQGNIQAAEADLENAREEVSRVQLALRAQAEPLLETYRAATAEAARYRTVILPRATRAEELYQTKYAQMAQAYPQVLVSRRTLLELQLHSIQTLATIQRTAATLTSGTLTGSLNPTPAQPFSTLPATTPE